MNNQRRKAVLREIVEKGYPINEHAQNLLELIGLKLKIHFLNPRRMEVHEDYEYLHAFVQIIAILELEESTELIIAPGLFDTPAAINLRFSNGDSGTSSVSLLVRKKDAEDTINIVGDISKYPTF